MQVTVYSTSWCRDCHNLHRFLAEQKIAYDEIDVDQNAEAEAELLRRVGKRAVPQIVIDGEWFQPYKPGEGLLFDELYKRLRIHCG
jgi:mycoredoxin